MGQAEIIIDMVQCQLLPQAVLALAQRGDTPPDRRHMLADVQIEAVSSHWGGAPPPPRRRAGVLPPNPPKNARAKFPSNSSNLSQAPRRPRACHAPHQHS